MQNSSGTPYFSTLQPNMDVSPQRVPTFTKFGENQAKV